MPNYHLQVFKNELKQVWDEVVTTSRNGNFLHMRDYMGYHAHRFDEQSVIVFKDSKSIGVFPCNRLDDIIVSHGGLTYGGLIYGADLRSTDALPILELLVDHYRSQGSRRMLYKAVPHIFHSYPAEEDLYALHRLGARLVRRDLSTAVQLTNRIKLSDSRKSTIRKAIRCGIIIREGEFFESFHSLLQRALMKHGSQPVHTSDELKLLRNRLPTRIRLFGAFLDEQLLAAALIYDFGHVAHSQYLASSDEGKATGALDLLLEHLLDDTFNQRSFLSFGISTEQQGKHLNEGLVFQKEGFGGRAIVHDFYELEL